LAEPQLHAPLRPCYPKPVFFRPLTEHRTGLRVWVGVPRLTIPLCLALGLTLGASACKHGDEGTSAPGTGSARWSEAGLTGATVADEGAVLADALASQDPGEALAALDRTLDLFDAARFGDLGPALDALWLALGDPMGPSRGPEATRDAVNRMLQAAWAIEDAHPDLAGPERQFLNDAIALLSVDLTTPATADDLSIQTAAYRDLAREGHPRVADNAHWRLYDHVRGVLQATTEVPAQHRAEVAAHVLYAQRESIAEHLNDAGPHGQAPLPSGEELWAMLETHRQPLLALPRWEPIVKKRAVADEWLRESSLTLLPVPRDPAWEVPEVPLGTGRAESLAPVVWARPAGVIVDPGHPGASVSVTAERKALTERISAATAADGRGKVLLVAPGDLPSPDFGALLAAAAHAELATVELAVREPDGTLTALPLQVVGRGGSLGSSAFLDARIALVLDGRGIRASVDGQWLPGFAGTASEQRDLLELLRRAYPREKVVSLEITRNVQPRQLVELAAAAIGGQSPRYAAIGWLAGGLRDRPSEGVARTRNEVELRATLWAPIEGDGTGRIEIRQAYPLPGDDQQRVASLGRDLARCLPELEAKATGASVDVSFKEGRATGHELGPLPRKVKKDARQRFDACVDASLDTFRLRQQRDAVVIGFDLSPPG